MNPADVASRGTTPAELIDHPLWWSGPPYLAEAQPITRQVLLDEASASAEYRGGRVVAATTTTTSTTLPAKPYRPLENFSSYTLLVRTFARMVRLCRLESQSPPLTAEETSHAENIVVHWVQQEVYAEELRLLRRQQPLPPTHKLTPLNPFIAEDGILRVGGRLHYAEISDTARNPAILPSNHHFTRLLIENIHQKHFHAGPQLTLFLLRQCYWVIPNARKCVRSIFRACTTCIRYCQQPPLGQIMGDLPVERVRAAFPFQNVGIDYAGPFRTILSRKKRRPIQKSYIAVFVCLASKAVHLEIASDLTTDIFLAAFRRFTSRRGLPEHVFSDNGTNFVGADRELRRLLAQNQNKDVARFASDLRIQWHFNTPHTPHQGGIWEAAVKALKIHLKKVIGTQHLTIEELTTITCQIEACLNSCPLYPMSSSAQDLEVIMPGHFLIGRPLVTPPMDTKPAPGKKMAPRPRWHLLQSILADTWKQWKMEYLNSLQQRTKWITARSNLQVNDVVIVKENHLPPCKWLLARVTETFPDQHGNVRRVNLKTAAGTMQKHVRYLLAFPRHHKDTNT